MMGDSLDTLMAGTNKLFVFPIFLECVTSK